MSDGATRAPSPSPASQIPVISLDEAASTNSEAMSRALSGAALPLWVVARRQTAGRGRSGRVWTSQEGNLHASLGVMVACEPARIAGLSLVAGVAVVEFLRTRAAGTTLSPAAICLKWPNDILVDRRKAGGILIESSTVPGTPGRIAVIGIGLNLASHPEFADRPATNLRAQGLALPVDEVIGGISERLMALLAEWEKEQELSGILTRWQACATPRGEMMTVHGGDALARGRFAGLASDGALLLEDDAGELRRFTFGDVTLGGADRAT